MSDLAPRFNNKVNLGISFALIEAIPNNRKFVENRVGKELADILDRAASNTITIHKKVIDKQIKIMLDMGLHNDKKMWEKVAEPEEIDIDEQTELLLKLSPQVD